MEQNEIYGEFAYVYDEFMDNIPYEQWHDYLHKLLIKYGVEKGIITELACGTGTMTKLLADDGYDMIGIDISYEMLDVARQKYTDDNILFLNQDMRELDLYGTAAAMVCVCDGMNYITDEKELLKVFEKIKIFLDYNGVFIFDMKTRHFYKRKTERMQVLSGKTNSTKIPVSMNIFLRYTVLLMMKMTFLRGRKRYIIRGHMILN